MKTIYLIFLFISLSFSQLFSQKNQIVEDEIIISLKSKILNLSTDKTLFFLNDSSKKMMLVK